MWWVNDAQAGDQSASLLQIPDDASVLRSARIRVQVSGGAYEELIVASWRGPDAAVRTDQQMSEEARRASAKIASAVGEAQRQAFLDSSFEVGSSDAAKLRGHCQTVRVAASMTLMFPTVCDQIARPVLVGPRVIPFGRKSCYRTVVGAERNVGRAKPKSVLNVVDQISAKSGTEN